MNLGKDSNQLDFFAPEPEIIFEDTTSPLFDELEKLDLMNMTPIQALTKLHELKTEFLN